LGKLFLVDSPWSSSLGHKKPSCWAGPSSPCEGLCPQTVMVHGHGHVLMFTKITDIGSDSVKMFKFDVLCVCVFSGGKDTGLPVVCMESSICC